MNTMKSALPVLALVLGALATGCATPLAPMQAASGPKLPDAGPSHQYKVEFPDEGHGMARYIRLTLGADIARDCGLVQTHFEFDSAEPLPQDKLVLRSLAQCLDRPALLGAKLSLEGGADSRGTTTYNAALGLRRADRVKMLLVAAGMAPERISTLSHGDVQAVGDDMLYSYGYDRRVDARVHVVHAPH
jgi:peptidoglycan-associated lipoprotein